MIEHTSHGDEHRCPDHARCRRRDGRRRRGLRRGGRRAHRRMSRPPGNDAQLAKDRPRLDAPRGGTARRRGRRRGSARADRSQARAEHPDDHQPSCCRACEPGSGDDQQGAGARGRGGLAHPWIVVDGGPTEVSGPRPGVRGRCPRPAVLGLQDTNEVGPVAGVCRTFGVEEDHVPTRLGRAPQRVGRVLGTQLDEPLEAHVSQVRPGLRRTGGVEIDGDEVSADAPGGGRHQPQRGIAVGGAGAPAAFARSAARTRTASRPRGVGLDIAQPIEPDPPRLASCARPGKLVEIVDVSETAVRPSGPPSGLPSLAKLVTMVAGDRHRPVKAARQEFSFRSGHPALDFAATRMFRGTGWACSGAAERPAGGLPPGRSQQACWITPRPTSRRGAPSRGGDRAPRSRLRGSALATIGQRGRPPPTALRGSTRQRGAERAAVTIALRRLPVIRSGSLQQVLGSLARGAVVLFGGTRGDTGPSVRAGRLDTAHVHRPHARAQPRVVRDGRMWQPRQRRRLSQASHTSLLTAGRGSVATGARDGTRPLMA